jgi:hypothetical protein
MLGPWFSQEMTATFLAQLCPRLGQSRIAVVMDHTPDPRGGRRRRVGPLPEQGPPSATL